MIKVHHTGVFYNVTEFNNEVKQEMEVYDVNEDSLGVEFFEIKKLTKENLSAIAIIELEN